LYSYFQFILHSTPSAGSGQAKNRLFGDFNVSRSLIKKLDGYPYGTMLALSKSEGACPEQKRRVGTFLITK